MKNKHIISLKRKKYRALYKLEAGVEIPMFILSLVWLYLLIVDLVRGLGAIEGTFFTLSGAFLSSNIFCSYTSQQINGPILNKAGLRLPH